LDTTVAENKKCSNHFPSFLVFHPLPQECERLSQEWLIRTLASLGLKRTDAQVYVFLTKAGSQKAKTIANQMGMYKQKLYRSLKTLQAKGMVNATREHPAIFSAVSLEKVLDAFIEAKKEEAQRVEQNKDEILSSWQSILMENVTT
jgi:sugar-specific transcriptional regulator TrmB